MKDLDWRKQLVEMTDVDADRLERGELAHLLTPLEPELEERLVRIALAQLRALSAPRCDSPKAAPRRVLSGPHRRWMLTAGALAAAACLAMLLRVQPDNTPLTAYRIMVRGDEQTMGSVAATVGNEVTVSSDSVLHVVLVPDKRIDVTPHVRAYLRQGGSLRPWPVSLAHSLHGAFFLRAPAAELGLRPGHCELLFAISHSPSTPTDDEFLRAVQGSQPLPATSWQMLRQTLDIR